MYLNPKRGLVRYAYSLSTRNPGQNLWRTTLCGFFWRVVFTTAGWAAILLFLSLVIHLIVANPLQALLGLLIVVGYVAAFVAVVSIHNMFKERRYKRETLRLEGGEPSTPNVLLQGLKALKQNFCPIITFKED